MGILDEFFDPRNNHAEMHGEPASARGRKQERAAAAPQFNINEIFDTHGGLKSLTKLGEMPIENLKKVNLAPQDIAIAEKILGITGTIEQKGVEKAFKKLMFQFHPDRNPGNKHAEEMSKIASQARDVLLQSLENAQRKAA